MEKRIAKVEKIRDGYSGPVFGLISPEDKIIQQHPAPSEKEANSFFKSEIASLVGGGYTHLLLTTGEEINLNRF